MASLKVNFYDLSPVKREKLLKEENRLKRIKLRQSLPVLSLHEIRKYRLPHHEALCADLIDAGFPNSAEFIKQLVEYQDHLREKSGVGTLVWSRPQLMYSKKVLEYLFNTLGKAEDFYNKGQHILEWDELLKLAVHFAFGNDEWWWLGKQVLFQCVSLEYEGRFEKLQATSYYLLGKFLQQIDRSPDGAIFWLDLARELSEGKSWTAKKLLDDDTQDVIYLESCSLLYEALFEKAKEFIKTDPKEAIETCILARKRAAEGCRHDGEAQAYILKGQCELLLSDTTSAIISFIKALKIEIKRESIIGICEARIHLALAYLQHGKCDEALSNLEELKKFGEEHELPYYIGQAYRYMGEYYLNGGNPSLATTLLTTAFYKFDQDGNIICREEVRTLAAISAGEEYYPLYVKLLVSSEANREILLKLVRWKDSRQIFWMDNFSDISFTCKDALRVDSLEINEELEIIQEEEEDTEEDTKGIEEEIQDTENIEENVEELPENINVEDEGLNQLSEVDNTEETVLEIHEEVNLDQQDNAEFKNEEIIPEAEETINETEVTVDENNTQAQE